MQDILIVNPIGQQYKFWYPIAVVNLITKFDIPCKEIRSQNYLITSISAKKKE